MLFLRFLLAVCSIFSVLSKNCYRQSSTFASNSSFFDAFDFVTENDPTHGYVDFVGRDEAFALGLAGYTGDNKVYIGVDHSNVVPDWNRGRKSIRLSSHRVLNGNNLLIIDLDHMPSTDGRKAPAGCSVWPAFWTFGPNWPYGGEIDIIEYVNTDATIATTLHTNEGCNERSEDPNSFSGSWSISGLSGQPSDNCDVNAWGQYANAGCSIFGSQNTVGAAFNGRGNGGVYAMEWNQDSEIRAFFFPRDNVPWDITNRNPNPDSWGKPYARFAIGPNSDCSANHFANHNIIFDTTFCGDWAGSVFNQVCGGMSCVDFVKYNPEEFAQSFWLVNYVDVYDSCY